MKKTFFLLLLASMLVLSTSCRKSDFIITSSEISVLSRTEIYALEIIDEYLMKAAKIEDGIYVEGGIYSERLKNAIDDFKKWHYLKAKGIQSRIMLKNNSGEVIEDAYITVVITFEFNNETFYYFKTNNLVESIDPWGPDETREFLLLDVIRLAAGQCEVLDVHNPKKVTIDYYFLAKNNIGYKNVKEQINSLHRSKYFGNFYSRVITKDEMRSFGNRILEENITNEWLETYKSVNSAISASEKEIIDFIDEHRLFNTYEIFDAIRIRASVNLELRNDDSELGKAMNSFRDEYNNININKIGKSNLVFQPIGTNDNKYNSRRDATRITVDYHKSSKNELPKWNEDLTSKNDSTLNKILLNETLNSFRDMPFKCELITWKPIETGFINEQSYIKTSCVFQINENLSFSDTYMFFNNNEKVIVSLTSDFPCKILWRNAFNNLMDSFTFLNKYLI